jgi:hypothetical protein
MAQLQNHFMVNKDQPLQALSSLEFLLQEIYETGFGSSVRFKSVSARKSLQETERAKQTDKKEAVIDPTKP